MGQLKVIDMLIKAQTMHLLQCSILYSTLPELDLITSYIIVLFYEGNLKVGIVYFG